LRYETSDNDVFLSALKFQVEAPGLIVLGLLVLWFFFLRHATEKVLLAMADARGIGRDRRKFAECGFYTVYYLLAFGIGLLVLWHDAWSLGDVFVNWPIQPFRRVFRLYYLGELAYYIHAIVYTCLFDPRRSDFTELIVHHVATIALVFFSYWLNTHRIGLIILLLHNFADIFLYGTKSVYYWNHRLGLIKDVLFGVFALAFFASRLVFLPLYVVPICWYGTAPTNLPGGLPGRLIANSFLWVLQALHIFWFALIVRMVVRMVIKGQVESDIRSDDEDEHVDAKKKEKVEKAAAASHDGDVSTSPKRATKRPSEDQVASNGVLRKKAT
jgi:ceramide synthetase